MIERSGKTMKRAGGGTDPTRVLLQQAAGAYEQALREDGPLRARYLERSLALFGTVRACLAKTEPRRNGDQHHQPTKTEADGLLPVERPPTRFADVVGLEEAKCFIHRALILPAMHPDVAEVYGVRPGGGLMLWGPPGTGKTMMGRAIAGELGCPLYYCTPADVVRQASGESETRMRAILDAARDFPQAVVFIDEIECFAPSRSRNKSVIMGRLLTQLLQEIDGFSKERNDGLLLLGATNRPDMVDSAMLRPGRFDRALYIGPPDEAARERMFRANLKGRRVSDAMDYPTLARRTTGFTGADITAVSERAARRRMERTIADGTGPVPVSTQDVLSEIAGTSPSVPPELEAEYLQLAKRRWAGV